MHVVRPFYGMLLNVLDMRIEPIALCTISLPSLHIDIPIQPLREHSVLPVNVAASGLERETDFKSCLE
jgi:hypothetical protein